MIISVLPCGVIVTLVEPWLGFWITTFCGAGTVACFATLASVVLSRLSVAFAVTFPFGIGLVGLIVTRPFPFAVPSPNSCPEWS